MLVCSFEISIPSKFPKTEVYEEGKRVISEYGFGCFILNTDAFSKMSSQHRAHGWWGELQQMIT